MDRDARLYALVEELRHGRCSTRDLAERLSVSRRTITRDLGILRRCGVPIAGRRGAYALSLGPGCGHPDRAVHAVADGLVDERVIYLGYADRHGRVTHRLVEPCGFVRDAGRWYLLAWCRLRNGVRAFRLDRVLWARTTPERLPR